MDILAHGLWAHAVFEAAYRAKGRPRSRREKWTTVFFSVAPDLIAFGPFFIVSLFTGFPQGGLGRPPDPALIPSYIYELYNLTHSAVIFAAVFLLVWFIRRKPYLPLLAWILHIGIDVWTHTASFFPTPIFFPFSGYVFDGLRWGEPLFMVLNYSALAAVYIFLRFFRRAA